MCVNKQLNSQTILMLTTCNDLSRKLDVWISLGLFNKAYAQLQPLIVGITFSLAYCALDSQDYREHTSLAHWALCTIGQTIQLII